MSPRLDTGGAGRDRTGDLLNANQALSQLSYSPWSSRHFRGGMEIYRGRLDAGFETSPNPRNSAKPKKRDAEAWTGKAVHRL